MPRYIKITWTREFTRTGGKKPGKYGYYKTYAAYKTSAKQEVEDK